MNFRWLLIWGGMTVASFAQAQTLHASKKIIRSLCADSLYGRGYVNDGVNKAADFLVRQFNDIGLIPFGDRYEQSYSFPVNTHPDSIFCKLNEKVLEAGIDFLVDAGSPGVDGHFRLHHYEMKDSEQVHLLFQDIQHRQFENEALVLHHYSLRNKRVVDSLAAYHYHPGLLLATEDQKLTHTISRELKEYPALIVFDSLLRDTRDISVSYTHHFLPAFPCQNLCGYLPGAKHDSLLVFSAHYDHLGMMGPTAMFPGASDNASGVSMVLALANYYRKHKPPYDMVFLLFSGEEAGLMGSHYFVDHPLFDLNKIKMLINLDIMGDAKKGIVVVNGEAQRHFFDLLKSNNEESAYLPEVRIRSNSHNSDHYWFTEKGVPAVFIYSNGGPGFYHDVNDVPDNLHMTHYLGIAHLLVATIQSLCVP
jgi:hypothetical protein